MLPKEGILFGVMGSKWEVLGWIESNPQEIIRCTLSMIKVSEGRIIGVASNYLSTKWINSKYN